MSESARWRADASLADAIAQLSGLKMFALDRIDVLDIGNRMACLQWLHGMAIKGEIDSVLLFGTFKERPQTPETFNTFWIEGGMFSEQEREVAA
jgi:hypothetical protein